ncbi:hypothetical protein DMUE_0746 [Dictyocoela muelleri]|nr:hypothetical protein DMUE_0746 [Dictyocoela muelleri]
MLSIWFFNIYKVYLAAINWDEPEENSIDLDKSKKKGFAESTSDTVSEDADKSLPSKKPLSGKESQSSRYGIQAGPSSSYSDEKEKQLEPSKESDNSSKDVQGKKSKKKSRGMKGDKSKMTGYNFLEKDDSYDEPFDFSVMD